MLLAAHVSRAATAINAVDRTQIAKPSSRNSLRPRRDASPISSSSGATMSALPTSAPTRTALMGYETPNIDRIGREGIKFLHYYGEQSCTAGRAAFLTGQHGIRTGLTKVGFPGAPMGMSQLDPVDRRPAQEPRLRHRTVRQEPRRRSQRIAADRERLRRVLRQPLSSQRRGRAGAAGLSEGPGLPRQVRPARRAQMQGDRPRRSDGRSALRQDRQADDRGYRRADQEAHGDDRRRDFGRGHRLHEAAAERQASRSSAGSTRPACICVRTSAPSIAAATRTATASTSTACSSTTTPSAACSRRSTTWASPTTPSSSTRATTGRT